MLMVQGSVVSINFSGNAHCGWKVIDKYDKKEQGSGVQITADGHRLLGAPIALKASARLKRNALSPTGSFSWKRCQRLRALSHRQLVQRLRMASTENRRSWQEQQLSENYSPHLKIRSEAH